VHGISQNGNGPASEAQIAFDFNRDGSVTILDCLQDRANNDYNCKDDFFHRISVQEKAPQMQGL